ncbi:MAG: hypothetical protein GY820_26960 [Gammaproteobacteria bacterium]|nr:hypothetical protein [Gammaproteobacteria bacterium]
MSFLSYGMKCPADFCQNCRKNRFFEIIGKIAFFLQPILLKFYPFIQFTILLDWRRQNAEILHQAWEIGS